MTKRELRKKRAPLVRAQARARQERLAELRRRKADESWRRLKESARAGVPR